MKPSTILCIILAAVAGAGLTRVYMAFTAGTGDSKRQPTEAPAPTPGTPFSSDNVIEECHLGKYYIVIYDGPNHIFPNKHEVMVIDTDSYQTVVDARERGDSQTGLLYPIDRENFDPERFTDLLPVYSFEPTTIDLRGTNLE